MLWNGIQQIHRLKRKRKKICLSVRDLEPFFKMELVKIGIFVSEERVCLSTMVD